ncbi:hypothetical protein [Buttiauxella sp. B2]|uniref:hypothetical protein n=1 Tax=Buttiauxella sp. B2 TaxID=2587812 RepID=UPI0026A6B2B0
MNPAMRNKLAAAIVGGASAISLAGVMLGNADGLKKLAAAIDPLIKVPVLEPTRATFYSFTYNVGAGRSLAVCSVKA